MSYSQQTAWRQIQQTMPEQYRMREDFLPQEEWLDWQGHRVHLDCYRNPQAPAKVILFHGVGTNGRQMQMVLGHFLATQGYETIAIDMPTYGMTQVNPNKTVTYDDWIQLGSDYIDLEKRKDDRPIFLYGLSAGGMETYDVAAKNGKVAGIIGMTFLDQRNPLVRKTTVRNWVIDRIGTPLMPLAIKLGLGGLKMSMSLVSKMSALSNSTATMQAFMQDSSSAANWVTLAFLHSYMYHQLICEPEMFDVCPILLTQPEEDAWTPLALSEPFLARIKQVPVQTVLLPEGGHYPVEERALLALHQQVLHFIQQQLNKEI